ncbi:MAG TPA: hypothetical protein PKH07_18695, partial [bacterium]|nr:hypothetical protein [bacterium]
MEPPPPECRGLVSESGGDPNPFVAYLNSLHSCSAASENALAESQCCNPFFSFIHVAHPLAETIRETLLDSPRRHVILTGHAGDGKSTIAVEVFKTLSGKSFSEPLSKPLSRREDLSAEGREITLIKDFSEWSEEERSALMTEMLDASSPRFLLISNTGTLLDAFKRYESRVGQDWVKIESDLLKSMDTSRSAPIEFHDTSFALINVAVFDNLVMAESILRRMLDAERWSACASVECRQCCPMYQNVLLMQRNLSVVCERMFLAYRRMYEYGTRLTLRQLTAHMAYMITSGLQYSDVAKMFQKASRPCMSEFM